jgi:hypothetical protein
MKCRSLRLLNFGSLGVVTALMLLGVAVHALSIKALVPAIYLLLTFLMAFLAAVSWPKWLVVLPKGQRMLLPWDDALMTCVFLVAMSMLGTFIMSLYLPQRLAFIGEIASWVVVFITWFMIPAQGLAIVLSNRNKT